MADLEELGNQCPVDYPPSCTKIHKCDIAENDGAVAMFKAKPIGLPKPNPRDCLRLSEVFYRPEVPLAELQWLRIRNRCSSAVDVGDVQLNWTNNGTWGAGTSLAGLDSIAAHDCVTIGMKSSKDNYYPSINLSVALTLGDPGERHAVEGVGLLMAGKTVPFDAVLYGENDYAGLSTSIGHEPMIGRVDAGHSMWWSDVWHDSDHPSPHSCQY
jgi:hypothetical protein